MAKQIGSRSASSHDMLRASACCYSLDQEIGECYGHEELPEISSDEVDAYVKSAKWSDRMCENGEVVQVLSHTAEGWVEGRIVEPIKEGRHTVEFEILGHGHTLPTDLMEHDPGCTYVSQGEAVSALHDFVISFGYSDLPVEAMPRLTKALHLDYKGHNAFKASCQGSTLSGPFSIAYKPQQLIQKENEIVDVVLKVHTLRATDPDEKERYEPISQHNFVHTLLHKEGEKVHFNPQISGPFYLGITVNKDLSVDLRDRIQANQRDKDYFDGLLKRFKETWSTRGDAVGETLAENADYLISYTGRDKNMNDKFLEYLATEMGIKFCTDRSLGFGVHFHQEDEGFMSNMVTLYLGKHGFAQPIAGDGWWGEYESAAKKTKHGILVLSPGASYFQSEACVREWQMPGMIASIRGPCSRDDKIWIYRHPGEIIHAYQFAKENKHRCPQLTTAYTLVSEGQSKGVGAIEPKVLLEVVKKFIADEFISSTITGYNTLEDLVDLAMEMYSMCEPGTGEQEALFETLLVLREVAEKRMWKLNHSKRANRRTALARILGKIASIS